MKKVIFTLLALMTVCMTFAKKDNFTWNFPHDANGNVVFTETITNNGNEATNFSKVKTWINSQGFSGMSVISENTGKSLSYTLTKNTKSSYNMFAGQFIENLIFTCDITVEGNNVTYKFSNFQIQETYAGYGVKNKVTMLAEMLQKYDSIKKQISDAEASGNKKVAKALKKDNEDYLENTPETLAKASEELQIMINNLKNILR